MRTVASQMRDAEGRSVSVRIGATATSGEACEFSAVRSGHHVRRLHEGVRRRTRRPSDREDRETQLPDLSEGDPLTVAELGSAGHETRPPARYTEATLVRELEEREIGRPSTYASIIGTILNRGYVYKKGTALVPAWLAFSVVRLLERHFARLVDYNFTAGMEDILDEIAGGRRDSTAELAEFYFGSDTQEGLKTTVSELGDIDARELATFEIGDGIDLRVGSLRAVRRGQGPEPRQRPRGPAARRADGRQGEGAARQPGRRRARARQGSRDRAHRRREERSLRAVRHRGARGGRAEVRQGADRVAVQVDVARHHHPRAGADPADAAARGRRRPGVRRGDHRAERSLRAVPEEGHRLALDRLRGAAAHDHPRRRARRSTRSPSSAAGRPPRLRSRSSARTRRPTCPSWSRTVVSVRTSPTGRSTRPCARPTTSRPITIERAAELLAEKRAKGPAPKKRAAKKTAKKSTAKKATAKKATKK